MRPPIIVDEQVFTQRVAALIAAEGDNVKANILLEEVADLVYTRRMRINPIGDSPPKEAKPKGARKASINGAQGIDDLLGK